MNLEIHFRHIYGKINTWLRAFRGFYDKSLDRDSVDFVTRLLYSARSIILVISFQAAVIAGIFAYVSGFFNLIDFLLILLAFVLLHAESNLLNDYFGFKYGHDTADSPRRSYTLHPIADGIVTRKELFVTVCIISAILILIAFHFLVIRGIWALLLIALGILFLLFYDITSVSLKMIGLGEISSFIVWGPLMIGGGYFAITGHINDTVLLGSLPYGLGVMSVLMGKHLDQRSFDANRGIGTLPVRIGESPSRVALLSMLALMYLITGISIVTGLFPLTLLTVFLNYRGLAAAFKVIDRPRPDAPPPGYVGWPLWYHRQALLHNRRFGWLYILGLLLYLLLHVAGLHLFV
ncbi:MAG: prenyltransferase [Methanomassiliicoccales archaeon]